MQLPCCSGEYPCEISLSPTHKVSCYHEEKTEGGWMTYGRNARSNGL